jgi:hypothetical protein
MATYEQDTILCLAGIDYGPGSDTESRATHAAELWSQGVAPEIVFTGAAPALLRDRPDTPYADQMKDIATRYGVPASVIQTETGSITTIENFLLGSRLLAGANVAVVTSPSHIERAIQTGEHTLGPDYNITAYGSAESNASKQGLQEKVGDGITRLIFRGTLPGEMDKIADRHEVIFPGEGGDRIFTPFQVVKNSLRLAMRS